MKNEEPMRNINPFGLRLQPDLKARIEAAAEKNRRSINAEIHARLEESFAETPATQPLSEHEGAMQVLARMYQETINKIADLKAQSNLSAMEQFELQHEEATARYLRHTAARAAIPPEERTPQRKQSMPLGIASDVHLAALTAQSAPHPKPKK